MIHMLIPHCSIDLLPIEESPIYQDILRRHGPLIADAFVYDVPVPPLEEEDDDGPDPGDYAEDPERWDQLGARDHSVPSDP